jgi:ribosomal protein L40E
MTFHIFGFIAIIALAWILFVLWLVGLIFRGIWLGFARLTGIDTRAANLSTKPRRCTRLRCLVVNPPQANFCRRCGSSLTRSTAGRQTSGTSGQWVSSPGHS